jgi:hypothetical protein
MVYSEDKEDRVMKILKIFATALISALILGCATTRPALKAGGYPFTYEDKQYRIESVTPKTDVGYNILVFGESDQITVKAIDNDQDGVLDKVIKGDIQLAELQKIYETGLSFGKMHGTVKNRVPSREYRTSDVINFYVLNTYKLATGDIYNKLSIISKRTFQDPTVLLDLSADGSLNQVKGSEEKPEKYQNMYDLVLKRGLEDGQVVKTDGMFEVIANAM